MQIYFNWLGEWIELNNNEDLINNMDPNTFVNGLIRLNEKENIILYEKTLTIRKNDYEYYIPANLLVWKEKLNIPTTKERW